jgi:hypothetical protein
MYSINQTFFFKENNVSLLNLLDNNEKFDEELVANITYIIRQNTIRDNEQLFNVYVEKYGTSNRDMIDNVVKYLEKTQLISFKDNIYIAAKPSIS